MTEALSRDIERAQEKLRSLDSELLNLPRAAGGGNNYNRQDRGGGFRGGRGGGGGSFGSDSGGGMKRRHAGDEWTDAIRKTAYARENEQERGGGERPSEDSVDGPRGGRRRIDMSSSFGAGVKRSRMDYGDVDGDEDDYEDRPSKTIQSTVVMPAIESKSREQKIEEINKTEKKEVVSRNKRMFSNLLMGTLNRFKKEESKVQSAEEKQAEKMREVERRLEDTKKEESQKIEAERQRLMDARKDEEVKLQAMQRKRALIQYAEAKINQYKLMSNFIETQTKPTLFFMPVKHTVRSLELLKNTSKHMDRLIELRQSELERELANSPGTDGTHANQRRPTLDSDHSDSEENVPRGRDAETRKPVSMVVHVVSSSTKRPTNDSDYEGEDDEAANGKGEGRVRGKSAGGSKQELDSDGGEADDEKIKPGHVEVEVDDVELGDD